MKFIYVFDEVSRNRLASLGFAEVKSAFKDVGGNPIYVFENLPENAMTFSSDTFNNINCVLTDTLAL